MRGVVVQRAHDHAACPRKHPSRIAPPWIGQVSHRTAVPALQPFVKRGMFRKSLQWRHAAQRKAERRSALRNPRRISHRIHVLIVPQERQSSEAGFNHERESDSLRNSSAGGQHFVNTLHPITDDIFPPVITGELPDKTILPAPQLIYAGQSLDSLNPLYPKASKSRQYCTDFYVKVRCTVMTKDRQLAD